VILEEAEVDSEEVIVEASLKGFLTYNSLPII